MALAQQLARQRCAGSSSSSRRCQPQREPLTSLGLADDAAAAVAAACKQGCWQQQMPFAKLLLPARELTAGRLRVALPLLTTCCRSGCGPAGSSLQQQQQRPAAAGGAAGGGSSSSSRRRQGAGRGDRQLRLVHVQPLPGACQAAAASRSSRSVDAASPAAACAAAATQPPCLQYLGDLGADFVVFKNDEKTVDEIRAMNPAGILVSPGPGARTRSSSGGAGGSAAAAAASQEPVSSPCLWHLCCCTAGAVSFVSGKPADSGISLEAVAQLGPHFPLFGVCMGHQCIGEAFGGEAG